MSIYLLMVKNGFIALFKCVVVKFPLKIAFTSQNLCLKASNQKFNDLFCQGC